MKSTITMLVIIASVLFTGCPDKFDVEKEKSKLNNIDYQMIQAMENGDIEKARELVADDWKIYSCGFPMMTKESWLKEFFPKFMPGDKVKIISLDIDWNITPAMAFSTSDARWDWLDGSIPSGIFTATTVYEKRNGNWQVVRIHFTPKM